jgi:predicted enzyme related to lactoylglutathione lyase
VDHKIVHFEIPADDPERAVRFYNDLFGWNIQKDTSMGDFPYWFFHTSSTPGEGGGLMNRMHPGQGVTVYINVESVDEYAAKAQSLGAEIVVPKMAVADMGWLAQFKDTEGNVIAIWENNPAHGQAQQPA